MHKGVRGFVTSTIGHAIKQAAVQVDGINHFVKTANFGDYWRILLPGRYNITVSARGYESYTQEVTVPESGSVQYNVTLMKDDPLHWGSAYDFGIAMNQYHPKYHDNSELYTILGDLENRYPSVAEFEAGDNIISMAIHSLKITHEVMETKISRVSRLTYPSICLLNMNINCLVHLVFHFYTLHITC